MRIIALETSQQNGSIALLDADQVICQGELPTGQRTAQTLVPGIRQALQSAGWSSRDVELVAVASGPGSFTGLRIGVTTAKVFAYAIGSPIVDINTLDVLAAQCPPNQPPMISAPELWAVMDAQRGELFAARFTAGGGTWNMVTPTHVVPRDAWCAQLTAGAAVTGPGLRGLEHRFESHAYGIRFSAHPLATICVTSPDCWAPRAATVGFLAGRRYAAGHRCDVWHIVPQYFRPSAAEEKRAAQNA